MFNAWGKAIVGVEVVQGILFEDMLGSVNAVVPVYVVDDEAIGYSSPIYTDVKKDYQEWEVAGDHRYPFSLSHVFPQGV